MRARVLLSLALVVGIATAVCCFLVTVSLIVGTLLLLLSLATTDPAEAAERRWAAPVRGSPTRLFDLGPDPFARGQHRGVDFSAARGDRVRAACGGRVVFAGQVAGAGTVSVRCGAWRVTYAPLVRIAVRAGARVGSGGRLGRAAAALHLGVRREGRRFGYVDPLRFLDARRSSPPPLLVPPQAVRRWAAPRGPPPFTRPHPARAHPVGPDPGLAPWPVWLGLTLLLTGLVGAGRLSLPFRRQEEAACRASSTSSSSPTTPSSP